MKKICVLLLSVSIIGLITSACNADRQQESMVKSQRRFAKYLEPQKAAPEGVVDLSEGPRQNYDAYFGPKSLNFDFKIEDPY